VRACDTSVTATKWPLVLNRESLFDFDSQDGARALSMGLKDENGSTSRRWDGRMGYG